MASQRLRDRILPLPQGLFQWEDKKTKRGSFREAQGAEETGGVQLGSIDVKVLCTMPLS